MYQGRAVSITDQWSMIYDHRHHFRMFLQIKSMQWDYVFSNMRLILLGSQYQDNYFDTFYFPKLLYLISTKFLQLSTLPNSLYRCPKEVTNRPASWSLLIAKQQSHFSLLPPHPVYFWSIAFQFMSQKPRLYCHNLYNIDEFVVYFGLL